MLLPTAKLCSFRVPHSIAIRTKRPRIQTSHVRICNTYLFRRYISDQKRLRSEEYTVGWISALPIELAAAVKMLDEEHQDLPHDPLDTNLYTLGQIGEHNVVVACLPAGQIGINSASAVAMRMKSSFPSIRFGLMVGIGGGVPSAQADIRLGDVVVSQPHLEHGGVVQYNFGKSTPNGFVRTGFLNTPPTILLSALAKLRAYHHLDRTQYLTNLSPLSNLPEFSRANAGPDLLFESTYDHAGGSTSSTCELCSKDRLVDRTPRDHHDVMVHYGTIASGNEVMRSGITRDEISSQLGGVLCFEMEAAGLMNHFPCLVIRGICDYADSHKNKRWQHYAAATAAAYAKEILSFIPAVEVATIRTIDEAIKGNEGRIDSAPISTHTIGMVDEAVGRREIRRYEDLPTPPKTCWFVPFARNPRFVGRSSTLDKLERMLFGHNRYQRVAITGLGGVGKTQVALELAYRTKENHPDCSVLWVPATTVENFEEAYLNIGRKLQVPGVMDKKADVKALVKRHLSQESSGPWLMVLDNADDTGVWLGKNGRTRSIRLIDFLPRSSQGVLLFTTRDGKAAVEMSQSDVVEVEEMDEQTATKLLQRSRIHQEVLDDRGAVVELLKRLAFLPLAIVQAAAYIKKNRISISEYLSLWQDAEENVIELLREDFEDENRYKELENAVATTWLISFNQIRTHQALAANYLSFMSCLDPRNIPRSLLPPPPSRKALVDAIGTLNAYSFITSRQGDPSYDLHRLVHLATRNWLKEEGLLADWTEKAVRRLAEVFPSYKHSNRQLWTQYLPHAQYALKANVKDSVMEVVTNLQRKVGLCLLADGKYNEAEELFTDMIKNLQILLGMEHPDTLVSMANLALAYRKQGRWKDAEKLGVQVTETQKGVLGEEHPDMLTSMAHLASTYWKQGQWKEAEELEMQVMQTRKKVLGENDRDTLNSMANLASTYWKQGRWKEAEELGMQVMETRRKMLGEDDPDTLTSMANLASTYRDQGRWREAEALWVKVIESRKKMLREEHPDILTSMTSLASAYWKQGRWKEAEELEMQVIEAQKRVLRENHPDLLISMSNLASTYRDQGRWKEAAELQVQVVESQKKVLGEEHPDTLAAISGIAWTYCKQGRWKDAEELQLQVIKSQKKVLGGERPGILDSMGCLAFVYRKQKRYKEAENLSVEVTRAQKEVLGQEHPDTIMSMANLASTYRKQGRWKMAEELLMLVTETQLKVVGAEHPNTLICMAKLAWTYRDQGQWMKAKGLGMKVMETSARVLGTEHPDTLSSMHNLAFTWKGQGQNEEALYLMDDCFQRRRERFGPSHPLTMSSLAALNKWKENKQSA